MLDRWVCPRHFLKFFVARKTRDLKVPRSSSCYKSGTPRVPPLSARTPHSKRPTAAHASATPRRAPLVLCENTPLAASPQPSPAAAVVPQNESTTMMPPRLQVSDGEAADFPQPLLVLTNEQKLDPAITSYHITRTLNAVSDSLERLSTSADVALSTMKELSSLTPIASPQDASLLTEGGALRQISRDAEGRSAVDILQACLKAASSVFPSSALPQPSSTFRPARKALNETGLANRGRQDAPSPAPEDSPADDAMYRQLLNASSSAYAVMTLARDSPHGVKLPPGMTQLEAIRAYCRATVVAIHNAAKSCEALQSRISSLDKEIREKRALLGSMSDANLSDVQSSKLVPAGIAPKMCL